MFDGFHASSGRVESGDHSAHLIPGRFVDAYAQDARSTTCSHQFSVIYSSSTLISKFLFYFFSFRTGVAVLDPKSSGKIGFYAITYYLVTTILAAILGILLVITIKPGNNANREEIGRGTAQSTTTTQDAIMDLIRNIFPENIFQAAIQQGQSHYTDEVVTIIKLNSSSHNSTGWNNTKLGKKWTFKYSDNTNILGVITFCVAFGMIVSSMGRKAEILLHLFLVLNEIIMKLVKIIMWYSPCGIMFLVAGRILGIKDMTDTARNLGMYMVTVIVGLMLHCLVTLCGIYFVITRKNPFKFYYGCLQVSIFFNLI